MKPFQKISFFFNHPTSAGLVLLAFTTLALAWANSAFQTSYHELWQIGIAGLSIQNWINDGLMAIFFLMIGLEIKRELLGGELSTLKKATFPVAAAVGGMLIPALIYSALNRKSMGASGWGIPMATDIAFAMSILSLLGKRIPSSLKVFLMALAIVDDLGAVLVIALFYHQHLSWNFLITGFGILILLFFLKRRGMQNLSMYFITGVLLWICIFKSGIHATISGVLLAIAIPTPQGLKLERLLQPWVTLMILPLFAFANAGVSISEGSIFHSVSFGIILGLFFGKQIGITLFAWIAVKLKIASLPEQTSWLQIYGISALGGIGFTMSIFIANLALSETSLIGTSKFSILTASFFSASWGLFVLRKISRRHQKKGARILTLTPFIFIAASSF